MRPYIIEIIIDFFREHPMIGILAFVAIVALWWLIRRHGILLPFKIDRKLLRFIGRMMRTAERVNTSSVYAAVLDESPIALD